MKSGREKEWGGAFGDGSNTYDDNSDEEVSAREERMHGD
jgi:hypothetical protein